VHFREETDKELAEVEEDDPRDIFLCTNSEGMGRGRETEVTGGVNSSPRTRETYFLIWQVTDNFVGVRCYKSDLETKAEKIFPGSIFFVLETKSEDGDTW
jgi:hypothetical protein